jgi:phosphoribosylanthranilate isomerase
MINVLMSVHLAVKELGGTGRVHNWEVSSLIVQTVPKAVFLAGGLNPQNIESAIEMVRLSLQLLAASPVPARTCVCCLL